MHFNVIGENRRTAITGDGKILFLASAKTGYTGHNDNYNEKLTLLPFNNTFE